MTAPLALAVRCVQGSPPATRQNEREYPENLDRDGARDGYEIDADRTDGTL
jgi:hypothetical protein